MMTETVACYYKCGFCEWNSKACGIVVALDKEEPIYKEKLMQVSKNLAEMATSKREESLAAQTTHYQDLMTTLGEQEEFIQNDKPLTVKRGGIPHEGLQAWNVESLEESLVAKQQQHTRGAKLYRQQQLAGSHHGRFSSFARCHTPNCIQRHDFCYNHLLLVHALPTLASELLPLPLPLRARTSRRCLAELRQGRSGILVKPKLNPLEGDSSLKSGHGQWWKKDSSAIHVIPKLTIFKQQSPRPE